jgi:hypothetical protein
MLKFIRPAGIVSRPVKGGRRCRNVRKGCVRRCPTRGMLGTRFEVAPGKAPRPPQTGLRRTPGRGSRGAASVTSSHPLLPIKSDGSWPGAILASIPVIYRPSLLAADFAHLDREQGGSNGVRSVLSTIAPLGGRLVPHTGQRTQPPLRWG